ncbi:MAG: hypothetical protein Q9208_000012 [Pyrenodesmia sp. 3 TL-2023]
MSKMNALKELHLVSEVLRTFEINGPDLDESVESITTALDFLQNAFGNLVEVDCSNVYFGTRFINAYEKLESVLESILSLLHIDPARYESGDDYNYHEARIKAFTQDAHENPLTHLLGVNSSRSSGLIMNGDDLRDMIHSFRQRRNRFCSVQREGNEASTEVLAPFLGCSTFCFCSRTFGMLLAVMVISIHKSYSHIGSQNLTALEIGCVTRTCVRLMGDDCFCELHKKPLSKWLEARVEDDRDKLITMLQKKYFTRDLLVGDASVDIQPSDTELLCRNQEPETSKSQPDQCTGPVESANTSTKETGTVLAGLVEVSQLQQLQDQVNVLDQSNLDLHNQRTMIDLRDLSLKRVAARDGQIIEQSQDQAKRDQSVAQELSGQVIDLQEELSTVRSDNVTLRRRVEAAARHLEDVQTTSATYQATMSEQSARVKDLEEVIKVIKKGNLELEKKIQGSTMTPKQTTQNPDQDRVPDKEISEYIDQAQTSIHSLCQENDSLRDALGRKGKEAEETVWRSIEESLSGSHFVGLLRGLHESKKDKQEASKSGSSTLSLDKAFMPIISGEGGAEGSVSSQETRDYKAQELHYLTGFSKLWQARSGCIVS